MRRVLCACCMIAIVTACQSSSKSATTTNVSDGGIAVDGKVPITTTSQEARALFVRGRALSEMLKAHDGRALFEQAIAKDSTFAMGEYYLATTAPTAKELVVHMNRALALASKASDGERLMILALQARSTSDPAKAKQYAETLATKYPQDERARWILGNAYFGQQHYDSATTEYQKAIEINPDFSLAYNSLGYAYRATESSADAEKAFQRYIALVPKDPNPYDSYAELLMKLGRFDESIAEYQKALSIDPHFGGSHVGIAADHMFAGKHDAAVAEAQTYYNSARDDAERRTALFTQALIYVDQGATENALQTMAREYDVARAAADTLNMSADEVAMGDILLSATRADAAREKYAQAHDLVAHSGLSASVKQDDALASHYDMARAALAKHDVAAARAEAVSYMHGAEARHNDIRMRQAHELNGLVALEQKQFDGSLSELALADRQNPAVLYAMAQAYRGSGDAAKANAIEAQAVNMYILPTLPYVFVRARGKHQA
jgi:tetratricopeptide (TPR) repeat protein